ncbi:hypothetical protein ACWGIV_28760 [Streptomyces sp. NPDC054844]
MKRPRIAERARALWEGVPRRTKALTDTVRSTTAAIDIWIQDHYRLTVASMLLSLAAGTGLLLQWRWDQVIDFAKQLAPVITIVSITASALLSLLTWLRKRHQQRLSQNRPAHQQPSDSSNEG